MPYPAPRLPVASTRPYLATTLAPRMFWYTVRQRPQQSRVIIQLVRRRRPSPAPFHAESTGRINAADFSTARIPPNYGAPVLPAHWLNQPGP
jgi:hypothetical protein